MLELKTERSVELKIKSFIESMGVQNFVVAINKCATRHGITPVQFGRNNDLMDRVIQCYLAEHGMIAVCYTSGIHKAIKFYGVSYATFIHSYLYGIAQQSDNVKRIAA